MSADGNILGLFHIGNKSSIQAQVAQWHQISIYFMSLLYSYVIAR